MKVVEIPGDLWDRNAPGNRRAVASWMLNACGIWLVVLGF